MAWSWKAFQQLGRFAQMRHVGIVTTTTTVFASVVVYQKLKKQNIANLAPSNCPTTPTDTIDEKCECIYLSGCTSGIKWDENWDR